MTIEPPIDAYITAVVVAATKSSWTIKHAGSSTNDKILKGPDKAREPRKK